MEQRYSVEWLKGLADQGEKIKYIFFWGHTPKPNQEVGPFVFSQWYENVFEYEGKKYLSAEHWMMAWKAKLFGDDEILEQIYAAQTPAEAKALGRKVRGFDRKKWFQHRYAIVRAGNILKFQQNPQMKEYLLNTGNRVLVEASPEDAIWGIGLAANHASAQNVHTWKGLNLLGFAIMEARDYFRSNPTSNSFNFSI